MTQQLSLFDAIQTSARAAGQTIQTAPAAPKRRAVTVEATPPPMPPAGRQRPALPPVPPLVAPCRHCNHAAYLVHTRTGFAYACGNAAAHTKG